MSFDFMVVVENWPAFARGLATTVMICVAALPIGFVAGTVLAYSRLHGSSVARAAIVAYVEATRNLPFLIQIFLLYFALPFFGIRLGAATAGGVALASYAAAYFSEIVRGAIATVPVGQQHAAQALGLSAPAIFRRVLLPQVRGYLLPAGSNLAITLIKESAVLSAITVPELTYMSQDTVGRTFAPVEAFTVVALLYWALTAAVGRVAALLERRWSSRNPQMEHRS